MRFFWLPVTTIGEVQDFKPMPLQVRTSPSPSFRIDSMPCRNFVGNLQEQDETLPQEIIDKVRGKMEHPSLTAKQVATLSRAELECLVVAQAKEIDVLRRLGGQAETRQLESVERRETQTPLVQPGWTKRKASCECTADLESSGEADRSLMTVSTEEMQESTSCNSVHNPSTLNPNETQPIYAVGDGYGRMVSTARVRGLLAIHDAIEDWRTSNALEVELFGELQRLVAIKEEKIHELEHLLFSTQVKESKKTTRNEQCQERKGGEALLGAAESKDRPKGITSKNIYLCGKAKPRC